MIVEPDDQTCRTLRDILDRGGMEVHCFEGAHPALEALDIMGPFNVVAAGLWLPDMEGLEMIDVMKKKNRDIQVIILTDDSNIDRIIDSLNDHRAVDFLFKPLQKTKYVRYIFKKALARQRMQTTMEEFRRNRELADLKSRVKSEFLADLSHELRNPLNSILGFSQVLLEKYFGPLNEKQEQYVNDIHESGQDLLALIDDILDLASPGNDSSSLDLSTVNICGVIESSLNFITQKAFKHQINIRLSLPDDMKSLELDLDRKKIKQILFNLLSSALNFISDRGSMEIKAEKKATGQNKAIVILISYKGIPSPDTVSENPNHSGRRIQDQILRKPNTRLRLANQLVELHGGTLFVDNQPNTGTGRFIITLPLQSNVL